MTDRELLEAAAKAAGLHIDTSKFNGAGADNDGFDLLGNAVLDWHNNVIWNPLADDGDALRLAVKLNLLLLPYPLDNAIRVTRLDQRDTIVSFGTPPDPLDATRRAIVRAAAAIGDAHVKQERGSGR